MNVSYDAKVDALYIKLLPGEHEVETRQVDDDIALNFDEMDRLVGIEVLDASKRLDLRSVLPVGVTKHSNDSKSLSPTLSMALSKAHWDKLKRELIRRKEAGEPVETLEQHSKNWIEEVGEDYVVVRRDQKGNQCKITRSELEDGTRDSLRRKRKWSITCALRDIARSL